MQASNYSRKEDKNIINLLKLLYDNVIYGIYSGHRQEQIFQSSTNILNALQNMC